MGRLSEARKRAKGLAPPSGAGSDGPQESARAPSAPAELPPSPEPPPGRVAPHPPAEGPLDAGCAEAGPDRGLPPHGAEVGEVSLAAAAPGSLSGGVLKLPRFGYAEDILRSLGEFEEPPSGRPRGRAGEALPDAVGGPAAGRQEAPHPAPDRRELAGKYVTFFLGGEEYALPITRVQEINRVTEITRVPNAPEFVVGVINLRGKILPVIELRRRLGLGQVQADKKNRVVVVEAGPRLLGLLVDRVSQVLVISAEQVDEAPEEVSTSPENCVCGVGKCDDRMVLLLDLDKVLHGPRDEGAMVQIPHPPQGVPEGGE